MYLTLLILPGISSIVTGLLGRKLGVRGVYIVSLVIISTSTILTFLSFYEVVFTGSPVYIFIGSWVLTDYLTANWAFIYDSLTCSMLLAVVLVSTIVHFYSVDYMSGDPHNGRFFSYLSIFTFFILILVTGDNFIVLFLGWEGIGVASYLLVGFWYTRLAANKAAMQAITVNRIGDMFYTAGLFALFALVGNVEFVTAFSLSPHSAELALTIVGLFFLLAAIGKSAQIGLHTWLPSAMEGPTPVSALIHAATLVTAGVYLLIRSSPLLEFAPTALIGITWVGAITALFAGLTGIVQNDLKRIIAFSTCSQIGYLFIAVGLSQYNVALFHLVSHAFFKALLFLAAGGVLHAVSDIQDIRRLGGLVLFLPLTYITILIGSLSLMAFPWLSGFLSKDLILELAYGTFALKGVLVYVIGSLSAALTGYYSFRLIIYTFFNTPNAPITTYTSCHDTTTVFVLLPYTLLTLFSIYFGWVINDLFVGIGSDTFSSCIFNLPSTIHLVEAHFYISVFFKNLPLILTILGAILAVIISGTSLSSYYTFYTFFNSKWIIDVLYSYIIIFALSISIFISKYLDRGAIEFIGPSGLTNSIHSLSYSIKHISTIPTLALYLIVAFLTVLTITISVEISRILVLSLIITFLVISI